MRLAFSAVWVFLVCPTSHSLTIPLSTLACPDYITWALCSGPGWIWTIGNLARSWGERGGFFFLIRSYGFFREGLPQTGCAPQSKAQLLSSAPLHILLCVPVSVSFLLAPPPTHRICNRSLVYPYRTKGDYTNPTPLPQVISVLCLVAQSCPTLCAPMDCSLPGSSVHGILQARILEWVAFPFSRGSSQPKDWTQVYPIAGRFFTS